MHIIHINTYIRLSSGQRPEPDEEGAGEGERMRQAQRRRAAVRHLS